MRKREKAAKSYFKNVIIALILTTLLFVGVFFFGYSVSYYKQQQIAQTQNEMKYSILSLQVELEILGDKCENFNPYEFSEQVDNLGNSIMALEQRLGSFNPGVLEEKKMYSILEAQHFLYISKHNDKCANKVPVILFFYSNSEAYKDRAEKIGFMLDSLKNQEEVMIYSFDYDLDSSLINVLKRSYNINSPNTLVVNRTILMKDVSNIEDIRAKL